MEVSSSSLPVSKNAQVPNRAEMQTSEKELHHVPRQSPRFIFACVLDYGDMHHYQRPKIFVYEAKITVGNALKTPEAPYWVKALNTEIKQLIDTGTLLAVKLSDVPADASIINIR